MPGICEHTMNTSVNTKVNNPVLGGRGSYLYLKLWKCILYYNQNGTIFWCFFLILYRPYSVCTSQTKTDSWSAGHSSIFVLHDRYCRWLHSSFILQYYVSCWFCLNSGGANLKYQSWDSLIDFRGFNEASRKLGEQQNSTFPSAF